MCWAKPPMETGGALNKVFAEGSTDEKNSGARPKMIVALGILLDPICSGSSKPCAQNNESRGVSLSTMMSPAGALCRVIVFILFAALSRLVQPNIVPEILELMKGHAQRKERP